MATTTTDAYGTRTQIDGSNLNSLANGNANACSAVSAASATPANPIGWLVDVTLTCASAPTSGNTIVVYLIQAPSVSGSAGTYTDGISPGGTAVTLLNAVPVRTYTVNTTTPFAISDSFRLPVLDPAPFWTLVVKNSSGVALASSGNAVSVTPLTYSSQ